MDLKATALQTLESAFGLFAKDLTALPEEAFDRTFGGTSRTVADLVHEVNIVNDHIGQTMREENPPEWAVEGWVKAPGELRTKTEAIAAFVNSSQRFIDTVKLFPDDSMETVVPTEQGESTRYKRCQFVALHVWYHSGQLNYIQTLLGDDEWHW